MKILRTFLPAALFLAAQFSLMPDARAQFGGTGSDGVFWPTADTTLDTAAQGGVWNFSYFYVPAGVTVTLTGQNAARIRSSGDIAIEGDLIVTPGTCAGEPAGGGYEGPGFATCQAPACVARATYQYNADLLLPVGGSRARSAQNCAATAAGGGFVKLEAAGNVVVAGTIEAVGDYISCAQNWTQRSYGSGGAVLLRSLQQIVVGSFATIRTDSYDGNASQAGPIRFESPLVPVVHGSVIPAYTTGTAHAVLGHFWTMSRVDKQITESEADTTLLNQAAMPDSGFGLCLSRHGAAWATMPTANRIMAFARDAVDPLMGKTITTAPGPRGIASDNNDYLWVACDSGSVQRFDSWGVLRDTTALAGSPHGIAVAGDGRVWVTTRAANTVVVLAPDATVLAEHDLSSVAPNGLPTGIAMDVDGNVWVTIQVPSPGSPGHVAKLAPDGTLLGNFPVGHHPSAVACDAHGRVWIAIEGDIATPGSTVTALTTAGVLIGDFSVDTFPSSLGIDGTGNVVVVCSGGQIDPTSSLLVLSSGGAPLHSAPLGDLSVSFGDFTGYQFAMTVDPLGDADGDGFGNLEEMQDLGNPFDPNIGSGPGSTYCTPAVPNSSGLPASIGGTGSDVALDNNLTLTVSGLPEGQFSFFIASQSQGYTPNPGGSQGVLCLGAPMVRFNASVLVVSGGQVSLTPDLSQVPLPPTFAHTVVAGESWNFQLWFRDNNPGLTSNFSDGLMVTFQ